MKDKRNIRKEIQFTEDEFSLIQKKSNMAGLTPAVFIRKASLEQNVKAALCQDELDMIRRAQQVSIGLQNNLNQIAKHTNIFGFIPLYESIIKLIQNIDQYFQNGDQWTDIEIPKNVKGLKEVLDEANAKYQDLRQKALYLSTFTYEGERYFKEKYKCTLYSNSQKTKYYFRVKDSNKLALEIPEKLFLDYKNKMASIKDIYDYWLKNNS